MDVFKNGWGLLVHGTLKPAVSQEWNYDLSHFLHAVIDVIVVD